jgi:hypothetical protein
MPERSVTSAKPKRINRWSKRVSPQQPQANHSIDAKFSNSLVRPVYVRDQLSRQRKEEVMTYVTVLAQHQHGEM